MGVGIHEESALLRCREARSQVYRGCGFSDATFLISNRDDSRHVLWGMVDANLSSGPACFHVERPDQFHVETRVYDQLSSSAASDESPPGHDIYAEGFIARVDRRIRLSYSRRTRHHQRLRSRRTDRQHVHFD